MKHLLLLLLLSCTLQSFAQDPDPDLFKTWYLYTIEYDASDPFLVSWIIPPISPTLTISQNLDFTGFGACNDFSGVFSYEIGEWNMLIPSNYSDTGITCEFPSYNGFESQYFPYFEIEKTLYIRELSADYLYLEGASPGFGLVFRDVPLAIDDNILQNFKYYPVPAQEIINLSALDNIDSVTIYNLSGQEVINYRLGSSNTSVDVSTLKAGMYFMKVLVGGQTGIYKIIKS